MKKAHRRGLSIFSMMWISALPLVQMSFERACGDTRDATISDTGLRALWTSKNLSEFKRIRESKSAIERLSAECDAELRAVSIPVSCFALVALQPRTQSNDTVVPNVARLTRTCLIRARAATGHERLEAASRKPGLSPECRRALQERVEDIRYIEETVMPGKTDPSWFREPPHWTRN